MGNKNRFIKIKRKKWQSSWYVCSQVYAYSHACKSHLHNYAVMDSVSLRLFLESIYNAWLNSCIFFSPDERGDGLPKW